MKALRFITLATLAVLALPTLAAGGSFPAVLTTPLLPASNAAHHDTGEQRLECRVVNISSTSVLVTVELIEGNGVVYDSDSSLVPPRQEGPRAEGRCATPDFVCEAYCRFTGGVGGQLRGSIILAPSTTGNALVALPAQ